MNTNTNTINFFICSSEFSCESPKKRMVSRGMQIIGSVLVTTFISLSVATDHIIGGPSGWTGGPALKTWAAGQTFAVGDNLVFSYPSAFHDVVEVSKPEFDSCQAVKPLITFANGNSIVPLTTPGKRFFICGMPGHCSTGMKLEVNVLPNANANAGNAVPTLIAPTPSVLPVPKPLLPLNPAGEPAVPVLSPSSTPVPGLSSSLPLIPSQTPALSPAVNSVPLFPGSPSSSSSTTSKTVGSFPSSTGTTADLGGTPAADSSSASKTFALGFGFLVVMMIHFF